MTTGVEKNAVDSMFEVNSNVKFSGDGFVDGETRVGPGSDTKAVVADELAGGKRNNPLENNTNILEAKVTTNGCDNSAMNDDTNQITGNANGLVIDSIMETNADNCKCQEVAVNRGEQGQGELDCPSPAGVGCSPGSDAVGTADSPKHDNSKNTSVELDGETESIDSGKSPKKKRGFLSGGLHIHVPKLSSRLSFGSDASATSTGSEVEGSPEKKKKKKDKKGKKMTKNNAMGNPDNVAQNECSESLTSEKVDQERVCVTDEGLCQPAGNEGVETGQKADEADQGAANEPRPDEKGDITEDVNTEDGSKQEQSRDPTTEPGAAPNTEEMVSEEAASGKEKNSSDASPNDSEVHVEQVKDNNPSPAPPSSDDQAPPSQSVAESTPELPATSGLEESTVNLGEVTSPQIPPEQGDSEPPQQGDSEMPPKEEEEKKGAALSGEEGEEEDEGDMDKGKQAKKKKKRGILHNVHFPHFGGKRSKSGERSSEPSSDSDRAMSPKRFGWKKRKEEKSPERRGEQSETEKLEAAHGVKSKETGEEVSGKGETEVKQDAEIASEAEATLNVEIKINGTSPVLEGDIPAVEGSVPALLEEEGEVRPEKLLEECQELVENDGAGNEPEEFASTDALLEEIAETITSIEKAQNLRTSQAMDVTVTAGTSPEPTSEEPKLDLQADIPANVDEPGISLPSAQITLAIPKDGTLVEVSEVENAEKLDGDEVDAGEIEVKETQGGEDDGEASPSGKEKSSRLKGRLHLPKFHLPKVHLSGKKEKKKPAPVEENQAELSQAGDSQELATTEEVKEVKDDVEKLEEEETVEVTGAADVIVTTPEGSGLNAKVENVGKGELKVDASLTDGGKDLPEDIKQNVEDDETAIVDAGTGVFIQHSSDVAITGGVSASMSGVVSMDVPNSAQELEMTGSYDNVDRSATIKESLEVVVVMNEGTSEEEESVEVKKEEPAEVEEEPEENNTDSKSKPKKGRFKMPSINFHLPRFGGSKKAYKVEEEVEAGLEDDRVEGNINGIEAVPEISEVPAVPMVDEITPEVTFDAEVNAGNADISVEPDTQDVNAQATNESDMSINVEISSKQIPTLEQLEQADDAKPSIEIPEREIKGEITATIEAEADIPKSSLDVDAPEMQEHNEVAEFESPDVGGQADAPEITIATDDAPIPAVDEEARLKAKRKGLSLPAVHFHKPKFVGRKWSRHPRFRSKAKGEKSLGASGKVTTSLPDVALATSQAALVEEDRTARRASDIGDPKVVAALSSEHDMTAAGDDIPPQSKSRRGRFRFPSLHFSLPRFSSLLSPGKTKTAEEEPEMTELKAEVEMDVTAEADIPKTNLDVVFPEIAATVESIPTVEVEGTASGSGVGEVHKTAIEVLEQNADISPSLQINASGEKADVNISDAIQAAPDINSREMEGVPETEDANLELDVPSANVCEPAIEISADIGVSMPVLEVPNVEAKEQEGENAADAGVKLEAANQAPELAADSPDAAVDHTKKTKKGFFPKLHVPKLNMKLTPLKFKSKGKKEAVEAPDIHIEAEGEEESPDLSLPNVDANVENADASKVDIPDLGFGAGVSLVMKSNVAVVSPSAEGTFAAATDVDVNVDVQDVDINPEVKVDSALEDAKISVPDVNIPNVSGLKEEEDIDEPLPISGTVIIEYDATVEANVPETPMVDAEVQVEEDMKSPELDDSGGATNQVLDLALGGADVDLSVDGNIADINISSEDEDLDGKQKKKKKKKKRKGLHMPSINLPKFNLRHDKKAPATTLKLDDISPDVTASAEVDISIPDKEQSAIDDAPDGETGNETGISLSPVIVEVESNLESPLKEAPEVLAAAACEVSQPEEQPDIEFTMKESVLMVSSEKGEEALNIETEVLNNDLKLEAPVIHDQTVPTVELVVESMPSVLQATTETLPDLEADVGTDVAPQLAICVGSPDAEVESPEISTSKSPKAKKTKMPKIHLPKMNFKFPTHKAGNANHVTSEDADVSNPEALSPAEIEQIEGSLPSAQAQLAFPTVEVNGVQADSEPEEISPVKKGKYSKRIGGKLKKMRIKGRGKTTPPPPTVEGQGKAAGVSLEAGSSAECLVALDEIEDSVLSCPREGAEISPDVTLESDSKLLNANADLVTSTPVKPSSLSTSTQATGDSLPGSPTTPQSMNTDNAIIINSLPATPQAVSPIAEERPFWVVVAIDFGTTFSGYAYSMMREPDSVHIMRKWEGGDPGVTNMKTPTTLLLSPEGEFHSFGFTARDFYHDMDHKEATRWLYFDKFKLSLHGDPNLNLKTEITAANGQKFSAIKVFEHSLRFFHDHALEELQDQSTEGEVDPRDIRWVLTVPAIWKQPAKQFMRQASYMAGLVSPSRPDQLLIALEPEAASIYIRNLRMRELAPEHQSQRQKWLRSSAGKIKKSNSQVSENIKYGTRYMVVDCGGGTVDITVHEVEEGLGTLKELHKAAGGMYGSVSIDQEFEQLLVDIFTKDFIEEFKVKRPAGWVDLMIAFEARKRNASPWKNNPLNVSLPFSFIDYYKKYTAGKQQVEDAVRRFDSKDVQWSAQGMLRFSPEGMQQLFTSTIETLVRSVEEVLAAPSLTGISYLFIVGGFAQSALLQSAIRKRFSGQLRIIIPRDLGLSILKGAVLFGLDPSAVRVRRSRLTYGVGVLNKFQAGVHPEEKRVTKDNADWCKDIFDTFVQADEPVAVGDKVTRSYTPAKPSQQAIVINIYCSDREGVRFITDEGVRRCGTLHIDVSDSQYANLRGRRELQLTMQYGDTEIRVSALDVPTGKCVKSSIDFLNK